MLALQYTGLLGKKANMPKVLMHSYSGSGSLRCSPSSNMSHSPESGKSRIYGFTSPPPSQANTIVVVISLARNQNESFKKYLTPKTVFVTNSVYQYLWGSVVECS